MFDAQQHLSQAWWHSPVFSELGRTRPGVHETLSAEKRGERESLVQSRMPMISAVGRPAQEKHEAKASLNCETLFQ